MVSGAHCIRGAGAGVPAESSWPPPRNPGRVHRSVFLSLRFVKKIAISPCPFFWPLMMASPPPPSPGGRGVRERRALGAGWWRAGRVSRLQATPSTGCPGRGTWRRSWRKAAEKVGVGSLGWTPSPPLGARPAGNCLPHGRTGRARLSHHAPAVGTRDAPWRQALLTARKGLWKSRDTASNPAPSLPLATVGHTLPFSGPAVPLELTVCQAQFEALS